MRIGQIGRRRTTGFALPAFWGAVAALLAAGVGPAGAVPFAFIATTDVNHASSIVDLATNRVIATTSTLSTPDGVAVNPGGTRAYVVHFLESFVSVIDTATNTVIATISVPQYSRGSAIDPAGARLYVTHSTHSSVSVIDTATHTVTATVGVGSGPESVSVNQAGTRVYVANADQGSVSVIDTATHTVIATIPVGSHPGGIAVNATGTRLYAANQADHTVSVIDTATHAVIATIPVGADPHTLAVNPAGTRVYVASTSDNSVSVIDTATHTVVATIPVGTAPLGVAVNPAGTRVYVAPFRSGAVDIIDTATNSVIATVPAGIEAHGSSIYTDTPGAVVGSPVAYIANYVDHTVSVLDLVTQTVIATIPVGRSPYDVAVNPVEPRAYVVNLESNSVSVIDTATHAVIATVPVETYPLSVAVDPTGARAYVTNSVSNTVSVIDTATNAVTATIPTEHPFGATVNPAGTRAYVTNSLSGTVSVIDTATNTVTATVPVESLPHGVATDPAGTRVYVTNFESDSVSVIDTATHTVVATVPVGNYPAGILVNPSGTRVYVANKYGNSISVIDTATHAVIATLPAGSGAGGIAIDPAGTRMCVINSLNNSVSVVDATSETLLDMVPVGSHPIGLGRFIGESPAGAPRSLLVEKAGDAGGTIRSVPAGIDCGALCGHRYAPGTLVTLTAVPAAGSWVSGWTGCDSAEGSQCGISLTASRRVAVAFSRTSYPLTVVNDGAGRVVSTPRGIDCGESCTGSYGHDTLVTLMATPLAGSQFVGWSGACAGAGNSCQVTMDAEKGVTATFQPVPPRIAALTPSAGTAGDRVLVTGSHFGKARGALTFPSGAAAPIKSWTSSRIEANVPAGAGSGSVTLTTADGRTATASYATAAPALAAVIPASAAAGSVVTLTGVRFGSMPGAITFSGGAGRVAAPALHGTWHDTKVRVTVPAGVVTGEVTLTTADGNSSSRPFTVLGPAITIVAPPKGAAGTRLTLTGNYFGPIPGSVTFAGSLGPVVATIKSWKAWSVELIVPDGVVTGLLTLTSLDGMTDTRPFTVLPPTLTRVTPGSRAPGGMVTLSGTSFGLSPGTVTFAGSAGPVAASLAPGAIWGGTLVKVTVPAGAVSGPLTLTRADGLTASRAFTVLTPTITRVTQTSGAAGSVVTISGANFGEIPGTVSFPGLTTPVPVVLAPGTTWGNSRISLRVPPGAVAGTLTLTTAGGSSASGYLTIR